MKTLVGQLDILETMTPMSFSAFRDRLDTRLGLPVGPVPRARVRAGTTSAPETAHGTFAPTHPRIRGLAAAARRERSVVDHFYDFLEQRGVAIPPELRARDGDLARQPQRGGPGRAAARSTREQPDVADPAGADDRLRRGACRSGGTATSSSSSGRSATRPAPAALRASSSSSRRCSSRSSRTSGPSDIGFDGGLRRPPCPPCARHAPASPGRSSIARAFHRAPGAPHAPHAFVTPRLRRGAPRSHAHSTGGSGRLPCPPTFVTPRQKPGRYSIARPFHRGTGGRLSQGAEERADVLGESVGLFQGGEMTAGAASPSSAGCCRRARPTRGAG